MSPCGYFTASFLIAAIFDAQMQPAKAKLGLPQKCIVPCPLKETWITVFQNSKSRSHYYSKITYLRDKWTSLPPYTRILRDEQTSVTGNDTEWTVDAIRRYIQKLRTKAQFTQKKARFRLEKKKQT